MSSNKKVFELIEKFVVLAEQDDVNVRYQAQRDMLNKFYEHFVGNLRTILGEFSGDMKVLKERNFNPKMFQLLTGVYHDVVDITKSVSSDKPYASAEKLINYVTHRPTSLVIDNLDFLIKHHLKLTNVDFLEGKVLQHPQIRSLDKLKALSNQLRKFMDEHQLIVPPSPSSPPSPRLMETMDEVPSFHANEEEKTRK